MCLPNNLNNTNNNKKPAGNMAVTAAKLKATTPWGRIKQQLKPRLSRKIVPSSKINLNNFWDDFAQSSTPVEFTDHSSEIHDNIINELLEL